MSKFKLRHLAFVAVAALVQAPMMPKEARADFFGGDLPLLAGILGESIATVSNLVDMLSNLHEQLADMNTMLSHLDPASFEAILSMLQSNELSYRQLTAGITSIGYTLQSVNTEFRGVYRSSYAGTDFSENDSLYGRWHDEVLASTEVAARSQAALSTMDENTRQAQSIVSNSKGADGVVAQVQAVVQMLGLIQQQNKLLLQSLVATGRVITSTAADGASEEKLALEKRKRQLANYTDRGPPVPPMTQLP